MPKNPFEVPDFIKRIQEAADCSRRLSEPLVTAQELMRSFNSISLAQQASNSATKAWGNLGLIAKNGLGDLISASKSASAISGVVKSNALNSLSYQLDVFNRNNNALLSAVKWASVAQAATGALTSLFLANRNLSRVYGALNQIKDLFPEGFEPHHYVEYFLQEMAEANWFPAIGIIEDPALANNVAEIIQHTHHKSGNRMKKIDQVMLNYYTNDVIEKIRKSWNHLDVEPFVLRMLREAVKAHYRKEYALTICCLATLWERLIRNKAGKKGKVTSAKTKEFLTKMADADGFDPIVSNFYKDILTGRWNEDEDVIAGVPNKNAVSHSKYLKYPNRKASLNAILVTDFILNLTGEEITNG